jgi:hypothetical protein
MYLAVYFRPSNILQISHYIIEPKYKKKNNNKKILALHKNCIFY